MQPDVVCQVGSTQNLIALPSMPWQAAQAPNLDLPKDARRESCGRTRQTEHIVRQVTHIFWRTYGSSHGRHVANAALLQGFQNLVVCATVQPVAIGQVGETLAPRASEPWH